METGDEMKFLDLIDFVIKSDSNQNGIPDNDELLWEDIEPILQDDIEEQKLINELESIRKNHNAKLWARENAHIKRLAELDEAHRIKLKSRETRSENKLNKIANAHEERMSKAVKDVEMKLNKIIKEKWDLILFLDKAGHKLIRDGDIGLVKYIVQNSEMKVKSHIDELLRGEI